MKILVQKYGGTSVSNNINRGKVVEKIINKINEGYKLVVVVSAIGREGDPYATDTLLSLIEKDKSNFREIDLLLSCGEIISSIILSNTLNKNGISNYVLTGLQAGIETDNNYGNAYIKDVKPKKILDLLNQYNIVIITGFQGGTIDGEITTLGRGGSDTSALVLGEALKCDCVEIYTDVDGVMTADPRIVPDAMVIKWISYDELFQLAEDGAKVIHPKAVEIAQRSNIIMQIKNTLNNSNGTTVTIKKDHSDQELQSSLVNSITYKKGRIQIIIDERENEIVIKNIMKEIYDNDISIDLINFSLAKMLFTIDKEDYLKVLEILEKYNYKYRVIEQCCKLSLIGNKIKGTPGVMYRIINSLYKEKINILQTSDSHTTIWCLIYEKDLDKALLTLHKEFDLGKK